MSEHRRKPPSSNPDGGRAAGRRGAQPPSGRRAAPSHGSGDYGADTRGAGDHAAAGYGTGDHSGATTRGTGSHATAPPGDRPPGGRAAARRAAQAASGGRAARRRGAAGAGGAAASGPVRKTGYKRFIDYPRTGRSGYKRWMPSWRLVTGLCLAFFGTLVGAFLLALSLVTVPSEANAAAQQESNVYYWADGSVMGTDGETNRQIVQLKDISEDMQHAVIAAENASFYDDPGIDPKGIARALFNMATGGETQGGSTITQQYVKNTYLDQRQTLDRKFKEMFISIKVGTTQDKDDILQGYLNTAWYGRGAYGIQAAAQAYFHKDAKDLNANESALLTATLKNANLYNPDGGYGEAATPEKNRARAEGRWSDVLDAMVKNGYLDQKTRDSYKFPEPKPLESAAGKAGQVGYLIDTANKYVVKHADIDQRALERGGYRIYTTFEKDKVEALEKSVEKIRKEQIDPEKRDIDNYVQFGAASVVPGDGRIVALYGGEGYDKKHFTNNADTLGVPVGSTWKPFVLAAAMEEGTYKTNGRPLSPESKYMGNDNQIIYDQAGNPVPGKDGEPFRQKNEGTTAFGPITLREAMERSINTPFVQLGMDVGMTEVEKLAEHTGIQDESMADINASFALGTSTPSAIRMADSYATFAASGKQADPYSVIKVVKSGKELDGFEDHDTKVAMDPDVADTVTDVLRGVVEKDWGTAHEQASKLGRPAAGKTGTTDKNKSAWFVGYTPQLSTAVTLFREKPGDPALLSMNGVGGNESIHGGDIPTEVWTEYMKKALKGEPVKDFPEPGDLGAEEVAGQGVPVKSTNSAPEKDEEEEKEESESPSAPESETVSSPPPSSPSAPESSVSSSPACAPPDWDCGGEDVGGTDDGGTGGEDPSNSPSSGFIQGQGNNNGGSRGND